MPELVSNGLLHSTTLASTTYELHVRHDDPRRVLAAFDAARTLLWTAPLSLGEYELVYAMTVERHLDSERLLVTIDGAHWKGGTVKVMRRRLAPGAEPIEVDELGFAASDLARLPPETRSAVLAVLLLASSVDGSTDPRELALVHPLLAGAPWGVPNEVAAADAQHAQERARGIRSGADVAELGRACAALGPVARETLVFLLLRIGWADGGLRPQEHAVVGAFMQGIGIPGERANVLAEVAADTNPFAAVGRGRIDAVRKLLDADRTALQLRDAQGWTLLHVAVASGRADIVDLLLERGADVHVRHGQGSPPLFVACNKPYAPIVERLLRAGARVDDGGVQGLRPLIIAASFGQTAVARVLYAGGAELEHADSSGRTALHAAAAAGHAGVAAVLLAAGAAVDARTKDGATPLLLACERGDHATVLALLAGKAQVHAVDGEQQTALHAGMRGNSPDVVGTLLAFGADPNAVSTKHVAPLHVAAGAGYTSLARLLLDAGAVVDPRNVEGGTPLFMAAVRDRRAVHALLLSRGADLDAATTFGTTPRTSLGAGLAVKALRGVPFALRDAGLRPDFAALAAHDDFQAASWMNLEGSVEQVLVSGNDPQGRPVYVGRATPGEPRARWLALTDENGGRWLPVFGSAAAAEAFRRATPLGWPEDGVGLARAVVGTVGAVVFAVGDLPVEGVVLDPFGPHGPVRLTVEECERIAGLVAREKPSA